MASEAGVLIGVGDEDGSREDSTTGPGGGDEVGREVANAASAALRAGWKARRRIARQLLRSADGLPPRDRFQPARLVLRLVRSSAVDGESWVRVQGGEAPRALEQVLEGVPREEAAVEVLRSAGQHAARVLFLLSKDSGLDERAGAARVPAAIVATLRAAGEDVTRERRELKRGAAGEAAGEGAGGACSDPVAYALQWGDSRGARRPGLAFSFDRACVGIEGAVYLAGALKNATNNRNNAKQAHEQAAAPALAAALAASVAAFRRRRDAALGAGAAGGLEGVPSARRAGQLAVQVTGCLRNIALCRGAGAAFVTHGAVDALVAAAAGLRRYSEVCGNAVRALAKVADQPAVVRRMDRAPRLAELLATVVAHCSPPPCGLGGSLAGEGLAGGDSGGGGKGASAFVAARGSKAEGGSEATDAPTDSVPAGAGWDGPSKSLPVLARAAFSLCEAAASSDSARQAIARAGSASWSEGVADGLSGEEAGRRVGPTAVDALWRVVAHAAQAVREADAEAGLALPGGASAAPTSRPPRIKAPTSLSQRPRASVTRLTPVAGASSSPSSSPALPAATPTGDRPPSRETRPGSAATAAQGAPSGQQGQGRRGQGRPPSSESTRSGGSGRGEEGSGGAPWAETAAIALRLLANLGINAGVGRSLLAHPGARAVGDLLACTRLGSHPSLVEHAVVCLTNLAFHAAPRGGPAAAPSEEEAAASRSMSPVAVGASQRLCALLLAHSAPRAQLAAAQALANSTRIPLAREALRASGRLDLLVTAVLEALAVRLLLLQAAQAAAEEADTGADAGAEDAAGELSTVAERGMPVLRACVGLLVNLCGDDGGRLAVRGAVLDQDVLRETCLGMLAVRGATEAPVSLGEVPSGAPLLLWRCADTAYWDASGRYGEVSVLACQALCNFLGAARLPAGDEGSDAGAAATAATVAVDPEECVSMLPGIAQILDDQSALQLGEDEDEDGEEGAAEAAALRLPALVGVMGRLRSMLRSIVAKE